MIADGENIIFYYLMLMTLVPALIAIVGISLGAIFKLLKK